VTIIADRLSKAGLWRRLASSMLVKVLTAMVVALVASSTITGFAAARFAQDALSRQARQLVASHLRVLQAVYGQRERQLVVNLRSLAETINVGGLTEPQQYNTLVGRLGQGTTDLQLDLLEVVEKVPSSLVLRATVGEVALASDLVQGDLGVAASRLLRTERGGYVQALPVAIGVATPFFLIGGFKFDEGFAFDLRRQLGNLDDVVLVASAEVVGSTLTQPLARPPAISGTHLPSFPAPATIGRTRRLVAYELVGLSSEPGRGGALGVVEVDPVRPLTASLARQRTFAAVALAFVALGLAWLLFRFVMRPLTQLSHTAGLVAAGDPTAEFRASGGDEVGMLAGALEHMRVQLATRLALIERQAAELQRSSRRTVTAQDEERRRIARDLHDGVQQHLVVMRMRMGMLAEAPSLVPGPPLDELGHDLDHVIGLLREVSHNLYPSILMDRGLTAALYSYVGRLPISTKLTLVPNPLPRLPLPVESGAYFTLCEALTNALKHSGASELSIAIRLTDDRLEVSITDNGRGFIADGHERGGLVHMEDRARSFGGELRITTLPGMGTQVFASFVVDHDPAGESAAPREH
jgi:signal transduction histidine kinase